MTGGAATPPTKGCSLRLVLLALCLGVGSAAKPTLTILASIFRPREDRTEVLKSYLADLRFQRGLSRYEVIFLSLQPLETDIPEIQEAVRTYQNYRHVYFPNDPGLYGMWNKGWQMARGEYITNLNLDDRLSHGALGIKMLHLKKRPHCAVLSCGVIISTSPTQTFGQALNYARGVGRRHHHEPPPAYQIWFAGGVPSRIYPSDFLVYDSAHDNDPFNISYIQGSFNPPHNSPIWRRDLLEKLGYGFDLSLDPLSDFELWLRVACAGHSVCHLNKPLHTYFIDLNSHNRRGAQSAAGKRKRAALNAHVYSRHALCAARDRLRKRVAKERGLPEIEQSEGDQVMEARR